MTGSPFPDGYDSARCPRIRNYVENLAVWLCHLGGQERARRACPPLRQRRRRRDRHALAGLHKVRQQLISEIRAADDLPRSRRAPPLAALDSSGPAGPAETEGRALERPARERKH